MMIERILFKILKVFILIFLNIMHRTSVHEENGFFFTVDEKFREKIKELYFKNI